MKLGFYYENKGLPDMDCSRPDLGNPGVGGTQYCFLLLIYYLHEFCPNYILDIYCNVTSKFPLGTNVNYVQDGKQAIKAAINNKDDYLIIKARDDKSLIQTIRNSTQKVITWGHNYYFSSLADDIAQTDNIVANIFVSKQQYDRYIDHNIIRKSTYIFNMLNDNFEHINRINDSKTVVYMGALIPSKGFHLLAKIWKNILKKCPDAKLKVLGSGNLYSRDTVLGAYGIAENNYEKSFIRYLSDAGKILHSVEFLGVVGQEKYEIFRNASVGVVNPSAKTETFGMGIAEMATCKLPVVTLRKNGHPDLIIHKKTGLLESSLHQIQNSIIKLLKDNNYNEMLGEAAKKNVSNISPNKIIPKWISLFEGLNKKEFNFRFEKASSPYTNNLKWLRIINRYLRYNLKLNFIPPLIYVESLVHNYLRKLNK